MALDLDRWSEEESPNLYGGKEIVFRTGNYLCYLQCMGYDKFGSQHDRLYRLRLYTKDSREPIFLAD
ncbi:hypothetical protein KJ742_06450, partial [Patescibacteria group bacterium]|nr:hypothetical protein [Patescibacteria group bacterium]